MVFIQNRKGLTHPLYLTPLFPFPSMLDFFSIIIFNHGKNDNEFELKDKNIFFHLNFKINYPNFIYCLGKCFDKYVNNYYYSFALK